jgi:putative lipoprotein
MTWTSLELRFASLALLGALLGASLCGQEPPAATAPQTPPAQNQSNMVRAIRWKGFAYTCDGGAKVAVYLSDQLAKVRYNNNSYLMHQTASADGNRYSDGKVVWWGKGDGGFLQEDTPDWNGKMIVQGCKLDKAANQASISGTVTYLQRMALPPNALILVQLLDVSLADAPSQVVAEQTYTLGQRQVPVPFTLNYDSSKIDEKHSYSISAKITLDGALRFISDKSYPVITRGNPSNVDVMLKPVAAPAAK